MEIPKLAIVTAIEGGWKPKYSSSEHIEHWYGFEEKKSICIPQTVLDPSFWECLGKELGWGSSPYKRNWRASANEFYNLILNCEDIDFYWKELLNV